MKDCLRKQNSLLPSVYTPWNLNFPQILVLQKSFALLKLIFKATEMRQIVIVDNFQVVLFRTFYSNINLALTPDKIAIWQYL